MGKEQKIIVKAYNQDKVLHEGPCDSVLLPTKRGMVAIMPYHEPILLLLAPGKIFLVIDRKKELLCECTKGVMRVDDNVCVVLVDL